MSYCINPKCFGRENFDNAENCQTCGTPLLIDGRYRIVCPLREPDPAYPTDLFEVRDWGLEAEDWGAVKVMKVLKYTNNPDLVRLFKREARTLMWLRDPGIPMVEPDGYFTVAIDRGSKLLHCLVMEKIEGQDLDDWIELNGPISPDEAIAWLKQLVQILDRLHERSLFHRDIKPSNLIVRPNGQLGLIDFGTVGIEESHKTKVGTAGYAAPEQLLGNGEARSDFFALGRTFVYLLSGVPPMNFPERKNGKLLWKSSVPHLPKVLVDFVDRLMEPMLERRPKNAILLDKEVRRLEKDLDRFGFRSWSQKQFDSWKKTTIRLATIGFASTTLYFGFLAFPEMLDCIHDGKVIDTGISGCLAKIGYANFEKNHLQKARLFFNLSLLIEPESVKSLYNLGLICDLEKQSKCAETYYGRVLKIPNASPTATIYATNNLARLKIWLYKDFDEALIMLDSAMRKMEYLENENEIDLRTEYMSTVYKNLGWAYFEKEDYNCARYYLQESVFLNPDRVSAHCLLAQTMEKLGDRDGALIFWHNCSNLDNILGLQEVQGWQKQAKNKFEL